MKLPKKLFLCVVLSACAEGRFDAPPHFNVPAISNTETAVGAPGAPGMIPPTEVAHQNAPAPGTPPAPTNPDTTSSPLPTPQPSPPPATQVRERRGVWVYGPWNWIGDATAVKTFEAYLARHGINEVYLSTSASFLSSRTLPGFIARLSALGVTVEALIGTIAWGSAGGRDEMLSYIDKIGDYNDAQPAASRYRAVHLDVEPWIGTGDDMSWVGPLLESYRVAREAVDARGMELNADMAGSKVVHVSRADRQTMIDTVERITLMQYESSFSDVISRTERFLDGLSLAEGQGALIAMRAVDFPNSYVQTTVNAAESLSDLPGYLGWAHYHYGDMN